jgi:hypothetical protein
MTLFTSLLQHGWVLAFITLVALNGYFSFFLSLLAHVCVLLEEIQIDMEMDMATETKKSDLIFPRGYTSRQCKARNIRGERK